MIPVFDTVLITLVILVILNRIHKRLVKRRAFDACMDFLEMDAFDIAKTENIDVFHELAIAKYIEREGLVKWKIERWIEKRCTSEGAHPDLIIGLKEAVRPLLWGRYVDITHSCKTSSLTLHKAVTPERELVISIKCRNVPKEIIHDLHLLALCEQVLGSDAIMVQKRQHCDPTDP